MTRVVILDNNSNFRQHISKTWRSCMFYHNRDVCRPPRYMGDGFVILHSNDVDIYHYYDEPGMCLHSSII